VIKDLPEDLGVSIHGPVPPGRYWGYYPTTEIAALGTDPNATAVLNVGGMAQCGPHLPVSTNTLMGMEILGAALRRLPRATTILSLPPTNIGKSIEHIDFPGTIAYQGDTLRLVLRDIARGVAAAHFSKLVLLGSHGGNVGLMDDYFRDLRMDTGLRVYKVNVSSIANPPDLIPAAEAATGLHGGDAGTSLVLHMAPKLVHMDLAEGYVFEPSPDIGFSFKGQDVIEAWITTDLAPNGVIGNPLMSTAAKGALMFDAKVERLAELLQAIYADPRRESAPAQVP